ncbi:MAG: hypothetical protein R3E79_53745 [Caldilineaceae bacterium]
MGANSGDSGGERVRRSDPLVCRQGGFFEPAKALLEELGIYYTDLAQFNELAQAFGYLGFPEKARANHAMTHPTLFCGA